MQFILIRDDNVGPTVIRYINTVAAVFAKICESLNKRN